MYCDNQVPAGIIADKKGCNTMVSFTESGYHLEESGKKKLEDMTKEFHETIQIIESILDDKGDGDIA